MILVVFNREGIRHICPGGKEQYDARYGTTDYREQHYVDTIEEAVTLPNPFGDYTSYSEQYTQSIYIAYRDQQECDEIIAQLPLNANNFWTNEKKFKAAHRTHSTDELSRVTDWFTLSEDTMFTA